MPVFQKPVSGADKFFLALNDVRPPFVIQLLVEGVGQPEPEALYDALQATTEVTPGSALRYLRDEAGERWEAVAPPPLTVLDLPEFSAEADGEACLRWPLDPYKEGSSELLYIRRAGGRSALVFRALHAVMDGQGCLRWARDFFSCLRGEAPKGSESPADLEELIRALDMPRRPEPKEDAVHPFGRADLSRPAEFHWRHVRLDRPLHPQATARVALSIAALARETAGDPSAKVRVNLPCDLRNHFRKEKTTANFFEGLYLDLLPDDDEEQIGRRVLRWLYEKEALRPTLNPRHRPGPLAAFRIKAAHDQDMLHATGRYVFSATLSHLGKLKSRWLSGPDFQAEGAFFVPLVGDSGCVISLNGFEGHTECAVGLSSRFISEPEGAELLKLAETVAGAL